MCCFGGLIAPGFPSVGVSFVPRFPPPLHPRRGEGELEQPICFFGRRGVLVRELAVRVCSPVLMNVAVVVDGVELGADTAAARCW